MKKLNAMSTEDPILHNQLWTPALRSVHKRNFRFSHGYCARLLWVEKFCDPSRLPESSGHHSGSGGPRIKKFHFESPHLFLPKIHLFKFRVNRGTGWPTVAISETTDPVTFFYLLYGFLLNYQAFMASLKKIDRFVSARLSLAEGSREPCVGGNPTFFA